MIEKEIDYKALYDRLVNENEELHLALSNLKGRTRQGIDVGELLEGARDFIQNNYLVLLFLLFVASSLISGIYTLYRDRRGG